MDYAAYATTTTPHHHLALVSMHSLSASASIPHHSSVSMPSSKPITKRARKAINCEPCRASKLKCDRARPCSSCVLRGTAALCYQNDSRSDPDSRKHDIPSSHFDPHQEIVRIRTALSLLEFHMGRNAPSNPRNFTHSFNPEPYASLTPNGVIPASIAQLYTGDGGLYAGPTSSATFLPIFTQEDNDNQHHEMVSILTANPRDSPASSAESVSAAPSVGPRDLDMLALLPELSIVDGLINFYFESSTWENRYLDYISFTNAWFKFKENSNAFSVHSDDRLFLATVFLVMAIAILYLPSRHHLIAPLNAHPNDLAENYYNYSCTILQRYRAERHSHSLEYVELLLLHTHFLLVSKERSEDIWVFRGELISIACAMGLHRDPSMWKIPKEEAERRRWVWWNILLTDRWTAFLLGRPLGISNHHFDTCMPGPLDPSIDPTQRLHLPLILIFRLVELLGEIMDDIVSVRPVPHERIMTHDKNLQQWFGNFPEELNFDDYQMAKALASDVLSVRREGLISLCMRVMYHHIRFTLHRPYAKPAKYAAAECSSIAAATGGGEARGLTEAQFEISLEIAINAADKVLDHATQAKHDFMANKMLLVPGHLNWGMVHMFNAAMFFVNQTIADPEQPGANLFRGNIKRGIVIAESLRGLPVSDKAFSILVALAPLCDESQMNSHVISEHQIEERENKKKRVLSFVQRLSFPCFSNPVHAPAAPSQPILSNSNNNGNVDHNNNGLVSFGLASSSASTANSAVSNLSNQNRNNGKNGGNGGRSSSTTSSHGSANDMYHSRNLANLVGSSARNDTVGYSYHTSRSPPQHSVSTSALASPNDGSGVGLSRSSTAKTPLLPSLSQSNNNQLSSSPLPMMNLQLSYQSQNQPHSHSHGLYPAIQSEGGSSHSQNSSSSTATHTAHVVAAAAGHGHGHNHGHNHNHLINPYLMNAPPPPQHGPPPPTQGARISGNGGGGGANAGENGAMWGTSMEVDSSWDGFLSVVPPTE